MAKQTIAEQKEETAKALERLHAQVGAMTTSDEWTNYLRFANRFHDYSPLNVMWMLCQWQARQEWQAVMNVWTEGRIAPLPAFSRPAAFSAWDGLKRHVVKGEKALTVLAPIVVTDREAKPKADGKQPTKVVGFRLKSRTFDVAQTEGEPLPENPAMPKLLEGEAPAGMIDTLTTVAERLGFTVRFGPIVEAPGANGVCVYSTKTIGVRADMSDAARLKTLAHETAHALLHGPTTDLGRAEVEVEAESVAYVVLDSLGVAADDYSIGYVTTWSRGSGALVARTAERVLKAARTILDALADPEAPVSAQRAPKEQEMGEGAEPNTWAA